MKIGLLGWDDSGVDRAGPKLLDFGRERGHEMSFFTLDDIVYQPGTDEVSLTVRGEQVESFDAIINRAKLYGDDWRDRVERLTMLSNVPGVRLFDPVDAWVRGFSKFQMAQRLTAAGLPVPPIRSATDFSDIEAAFAEWGPIVVKPSFGYRGNDVERITDPTAQYTLIEQLLKRYPTLLCQPFYATHEGEYRINVAGDAVPVNVRKLPPAGSWRYRPVRGASWERFDPSKELIDLAVHATRTMELTFAGLDVLSTPDGYVILEVNAAPAWFDLFGRRRHLELLAGIFDWVEKG